MSTRAAPLSARSPHCSRRRPRREYGDRFAGKRFKSIVVIGMGGKIGHQRAIDVVGQKTPPAPAAGGRKNDPSCQDA